MKTTVEIDDDLVKRAQRLARKEKTTFRALIEQGLRLVLAQKESSDGRRKWKPKTRGGGFVSEELSETSWERLRDEFIYPSRRPL
jgi:predicted transcriptional regulator